MKRLFTRKQTKVKKIEKLSEMVLTIGGGFGNIVKLSGDAGGAG